MVTAGVSLLLNLILVIVLLAKEDGADAAAPASTAYSNAFCASLCSPVCVTETGPSCYSTCYSSCDARQGLTRPADMGDWLLPNSVQHVGLTTSNLTRSVEFYTEMLGGVEVLNAGGDGWKSNEVYQLLMQAALIRGGQAASWAANLTENGPDTMNARYVALGNVVIELLDYQSEEAQLQRRLHARGRRTGTEGVRRFPAFSNSTVAPSVAGNMHISFNVRPSRDLNKFVDEFVSKAHARGWSRVYCDRLVPVPVGTDGMGNVSQVPLEDNSFYTSSGGFRGWSLAYCKGPDDEQLEFNVVQQEAASDFDQALRVYLNGGNNTAW
jgi:catechol 2,3-dioxygenase-like lactoylglutathione lyase family enzyme